jgi:hypothetical protein
MKNLPAEKQLTEDQLDTVRKLAAHGCKPALIRRVLGNIPPAEWRRLCQPVEEEDSPLSIALETGKAHLAHEVTSFMLARMRDGDINAARWLGERICRFEDPDKKDDAPRVMVVVNAPLSEAEYREVTHHAAD